MKFYPSDWRAEASLRLCSIGARGLWMEMLALMHDSDGFLLVNGNAMTSKQLSALSGCGLADVETLLSELSEAGVFSVDESGVIFSRRMRRDIAKAETDKANGRLGGSPILKPTVNNADIGGDNPPDKAQKPEARSQISSSGEDARAERDQRLEAECRKLAGTLPVLVDTNFGPIGDLLDKQPSLTEGDVLAAMRGVASTNHRLLFWSKLEPWIRRAARDRLAADMPAANYARAGPADGRSLPFNSRSESRSNAPAKTPSDFLRAKLRQSVDAHEADDQKLLS